MNLRIAFLDDDETRLYFYGRECEDFNRKSEKHHVRFKTFSCPYKLLNSFDSFDYDICVIDINLGRDEIDGFQVANSILKDYHKPVIMSSHMVPDNEKLDSMISKHKFRISEIFVRYNLLKNNLAKNSIQIFMNEPNYNASPVAG